jgi:hypothetical protein
MLLVLPLVFASAPQLCTNLVCEGDALSLLPIQVAEDVRQHQKCSTLLKMHQTSGCLKRGASFFLLPLPGASRFLAIGAHGMGK